MAAVETTIFLGEFETKTLMELDTRAAGTYRAKLMIRCNSLLSSIYIKSADAGATVKVNYFDTTTGSELTAERYDLLSHDLYDDSNVGETHRILVTRIHNKPQIEVIVTGGNVEFGVYGTAVSTFASDLDSAIVFDGSSFVSTVNKAMPVACLDRDTDTLHFMPCKDGKLWVTGDVSISRVTDPDIANLAMPSADPTSYSHTFPADTRRYIIQNIKNGTVEISLSAAFTTIWTLFPGDRLTEKDFELASFTLYFRSPKTNQALEIWSWS